ncbi:hypothetical protein GALL_536640 [mine drainage metagenome]|uniref:Uncharacterized protein n=1 Tax=mine drainage metagenome TaxID=410659 RepID=A0A1J5NZS8_9ZZZZ
MQFGAQIGVIAEDCNHVAQVVTRLDQAFSGVFALRDRDQLCVAFEKISDFPDESRSFFDRPRGENSRIKRGARSIYRSERVINCGFGNDGY